MYEFKIRLNGRESLAGSSVRVNAPAEKVPGIVAAAHAAGKGLELVRKAGKNFLYNVVRG